MRIFKSRFKIRVAFVPQDLWLGLYWKREIDGHDRTWTVVYLCLLPTLPIILTVCPTSWFPDHRVTRRQMAEYVAQREQREALEAAYAKDAFDA